MNINQHIIRVVTLMLIAMSMLAVSSKAQANCFLQTPISTSLQRSGSTAVASKNVPNTSDLAGIRCQNTPLSNRNTFTGRYQSTNNFQLKRAGTTDVINYSISGLSGGRRQIAQGQTVDYIDNTYINELGLNSTDFSIPVFYFNIGGAAVSPGTYTDRIQVDWTVSVCNGTGFVYFFCTQPQSGTGSSFIDVTIEVFADGATVTITSEVVFDPINKANNPKAIPGGQLLKRVVINNPSATAIDQNTISIVVPTQSNLTVSLSPITGQTSAFQLKTPSALSLSYISATSTQDDIEFSNDNAQSWTFQPTSGQNITHVRLKPKGSLPVMSSAEMQIGYLIK